MTETEECELVVTPESKVSAAEYKSCLSDFILICMWICFHFHFTADKPEFLHFYSIVQLIYIN